MPLFTPQKHTSCSRVFICSLTTSHSLSTDTSTIAVRFSNHQLPYGGPWRLPELSLHTLRPLNSLRLTRCKRLPISCSAIFISTQLSLNVTPATLPLRSRYDGRIYVKYHSSLVHQRIYVRTKSQETSSRSCRFVISLLHPEKIELSTTSKHSESKSQGQEAIKPPTNPFAPPRRDPKKKPKLSHTGEGVVDTRIRQPEWYTSTKANRKQVKNEHRSDLVTIS